MTMDFRTVKASIESILGTEAAGRYRVIGYQDQGKGASEIIDNNRSVQVYYTSGSFPKSAGSLNGPAAHDVTFAVQLMSGKSHVVDIATLQNPSSTDAQRASAIAASQLASKLADDGLDEMIDVVYNVLQDARYQDLGLPVGTVSNRWIGSVEKGEPNQVGEYVILTATMNLGCRVSEEFLGATPVAPAAEGAVLADIETNIPDSSQADSAPAAVIGGN